MAEQAQEQEQEARIRRYVHPDDNNLVRFMVGRARMEPLAEANVRATRHYWTIAAWIMCSCTFVQLMDWWPTDQFGYWGYLKPFPAFAVSALPFMFAIDWLQRSAFDEDVVQVLERPDIVNIEEYYARSPSSGLWVLEYGDKFVGLIAVDASPDSLSNETVISQNAAAKPASSKKQAGGTSSTATIRHLYVVDIYRKAEAQNDLIAFAVDHCFGASDTVQRIRASPSPLSPYIGRALKEEGFAVVDRGAKVGLFKWTTLVYELSRDVWKAKQ